MSCHLHLSSARLPVMERLSDVLAQKPGSSDSRETLRCQLTVQQNETESTLGPEVHPSWLLFPSCPPFPTPLLVSSESIFLTDHDAQIIGPVSASGKTYS